MTGTQKIVKTPGGAVLELQLEEGSIAEVKTALELLLSAAYEANTRRIAISKEAFSPAFFVLSTCLAGEILQKLIQYGIQLAIYGDYSGYTSKPLHDFIRESNRGRDFFFLASLEEAVSRLGSLPAEVKSGEF